MNDLATEKYDVLIVGGGVVGTALLYTLSKYTDIKNVCLIEKYSDFGLVNSASYNNSQTLHFGDIETNYSIEKARKVKWMADMVMNYLEAEGAASGSKKLFSRYSKMVLAVGKDQVEGLRKRFPPFGELFPNLRIIEKEEIGKVEPRILEGRDPDQEILALVTEDGYTVDFKQLCHSFVDDSLRNNPLQSIQLGTKLLKISKTGDHYTAITNKGEIKATAVIVAAGGHSLMIAKSLGYGKNLSILSMAGSFYAGPKVLNGKVYTIQQPKLPFAAIHGDPEVHNSEVTRFGPTALPIFQLERHNWSSFWEYWKTFGLGISPIISLSKIIFDRVLFAYVFMNFLYDLPYFGKRLFIKEVRKIVPSLKLSELKFAKGIGGTRPQIVNNTTRKLELGEAKLSGDNIIFNITPSPGASTCLGNAYADVSKIVEFLGNKNTFDKEAFEKDLIEPLQKIKESV
ncbi:MAG TPA: FAD-dependent oxidoreductase [Bacteroidales bacterium]|nr:FAD-dependent oxidoreductase [Bacteroidales bacterium]